MTFTDDAQAVLFIKANNQANPDFQKMREKSKELKALVNGENFNDELIEKIEGIESKNKADARAKFSRDVQDFFARLFQPIDNIYYATGGVKEYDAPEAVKKTFLAKIGNIRDGKPLSEWVQTYAIQLMNTDPNGVIFLEYRTEPDTDIWPTYKSIKAIRNYENKGQQLEWILFEPKVIDNKTYWRIVDDANDRTFEQIGNDYILVPEKSFDHPFGSVPGVICSNIVIPGKRERLPAIEKILGAVKEFARDQSILTLYKIYKGLPIFWRYVSFCGDCNGVGTIEQENKTITCGTCRGSGKLVSKNDVTDVVELPLPTDQEAPVITPDIAGYISPDLDTWKQYEETQDRMEKIIYKSHWGTNYGMQEVQGIKTATEVEFDKQPLENQLNKYADYAEYVEWRLAEWILNLYDTAKVRNEGKITINLGRRYIIESYDVLLERYEKSRTVGQNNVILDKLLAEYLGAKYRNNPIDLQVNLVKARVEPYIHLPLTTVQAIFGPLEAQRKVLFQKYWQTVTDFKKSDDVYEKAFNEYFEANKIELQPEKPPTGNK